MDAGNGVGDTCWNFALQYFSHDSILDFLP